MSLIRTLGTALFVGVYTAAAYLAEHADTAYRDIAVIAFVAACALPWALRSGWRRIQSRRTV